MDGERIVIGAPESTGSEISSGSAYIFRISGSTWEQESKLIADDGASGDQFGGGVSIDGDGVVVATKWGLPSAAYVFRHNGFEWSQEVRLTNSDASTGIQLGNTVSIDGDRVVIGSFHQVNMNRLTGPVYVFSHSEGN